MNTSISYNVNAVVKEDDSSAIGPTPVATLNPNPIIAAPTASLETAEVARYARDDSDRNRREFFDGPEASTNTTVVAADENISTDETDAMETSEQVIEPTGEPTENSGTEPTEEITATSSATTQAGKKYLSPFRRRMLR
jgi:hypothetical protein